MAVTLRESVILMCPRGVNRSEVRSELLGQLKSLKNQNLIRNSPETRCILLSGSHGTKKFNNKSAISEIAMRDVEFYHQDCNSVGIVPCDYVEDEDLPLYVDQIPDITKIVRRSQPPPHSFYADPEVNQMTFQVVDAGLYFRNMEKLIQDIAAYNPDVIMIGWCYSQFGDLSLALRMSAQFSKMIITHDLRVITGKPSAKLDNLQEELLHEVGKLN